MHAPTPTYRYGFLIGIVKIVSRLPLWFTYRISDVGFLLLYYLIGYRKRVVRQNLERAFPEMSFADRNRIARRFYRHFCDLFVEIFKSFSMSDAELSRRYVIENPELVNRLITENRSSILLSHHYGNFEWMSTRMDLVFNRRIPTYGLYTRIKNPVAEELVHYMRSRRGIQMVPMTGAVKQVLQAFSTETSAFGFLTDQAPSRGQKLHFGPMFKLPTATPTVVSKLILRTGAALIYTDVQRVKRGHYRCRLVEINAAPFKPGKPQQVLDFTDLQLSLLEETIKKNPPFWLWSHRRWKHKPRPGDTLSRELADHEAST
ncbi:MAG: lysophospholipid acyltransferase family protein [Bacteroidota bacterium]